MMLDGLLFDLRLAFRGLRRDPGFSFTAIATLTVALALNVTVYTIREAMVVRGLPLAANSERLVFLALRKPADMACCPGPVRFADFAQWRADAGAFQDAAFGPGASRLPSVPMAVRSTRRSHGKRPHVCLARRVTHDRTRFHRR